MEWPRGISPLGRIRHMWADYSKKTDVKGVAWEEVNCIHLALEREGLQGVVNKWFS